MSIRAAEKYKSYLYLQRPVSKRRPMEVVHRAKQFAPFAALRGLELAVGKQEVIYEPRKLLSEEKKRELDQKLEMLQCGMEISVTYFIKSESDYSKGIYETVHGTVMFFDTSLYLRVDDTMIQIPDISELSGDGFTVLEVPC